MNNKALIAISGGVDSAAAAYLTLEQGYQAFAATIKIGGGCSGDENSCASEADIKDARALADFFGIVHYTLNFSDDFNKHVIDYFTKAYISGMTPNPCVECNRYIKFGALLDFALEKGADTIVTGHYAKVHQVGERYLLSKAKDHTKDQSYVLWQLTQKQLSHARFPLADYKKSEVRELALNAGFMNAQRRDSQDICFIPDSDYASFIMNATGRRFPAGNFTDKNGNILGQHKGLIHYTPGQRKGLGISFGKPLYVLSKDALTNTVVLCSGDALYRRRLIAHHINLIATASLPEPTRVTAKIRYSQKEEPATAYQTDEDELCVEFDSPQRAISPGQSVVMYDGDTVIGGGIIKE